MTCNDTDLTELVPDFGHVPFHTGSFYQTERLIVNACSSVKDWVQEWEGHAVMTAKAGRTLTGSSSNGFLAIWGFTLYPRDLILSRYQAWKLPLLQLLMQFPRPPHGTSTEFFSILHLMGDPADSIASLLYTLQVTQRRLRALQKNGMPQKRLQELVLMINAYEECGDENNVLHLERLFARNPLAWNHNYEVTAHALAADRATKLLPVVTAIVSFLASIALSYAKIIAAAWDSRNPRHVEIYSIAFSLTLTACLPAVLLAATIGVPQSRLSVRRILCQFKAAQEEDESEEHFRPLHEYDLSVCLPNGAVPSWRLDRWSKTSVSRSVARQEMAKSWKFRELAAIFLVLAGSLGATILSARVPPSGCMNCRIYAEMTICLSYLASYGLGNLFSVLFRARIRLLFWATMVKDVISTLVVLMVILLTVAGSLNRPGCWTSCDRMVQVLPDTSRWLLDLRLKSEYPLIAFFTLALLVMAWCVIAWHLWDGMCVYLQRDDQEERLLSRRRSSTVPAGVVAPAIPLLRIPNRRSYDKDMVEVTHTERSG